MSLKKIENFIGGKLQPPLSGEYLDNVDPSTGAVYALVPDSGADDLDQAVEAAEKAFPVWRDMSAQDRGDIMHKLAFLIEKNQEEFAKAECVDNGRPLSFCRTANIARSIANLRTYADAGKEFSGENFISADAKSYTVRQPFGVVATISPWNLPLMLFTWKLAPALAVGNCVIAKPSEITPMTAYMLSTLVNEAGFPKGVLNIVHGRGSKIGAAITAHPRIPAISFTGGTVTGTEIYTTAAKQLKRVALELGGKNPTIVFDDADFDKAVEGAALAAFSNQGQICLCGSRLLVQESVYDKFKAALVKKAENIRIGDPLDAETQHGATVSEQHMQKVLGHIDIAKQEGGTVLTGGKRRSLDGRCKDGYFIEPTIIEGLPPNCRTNREEIFGPVVTITPFKTEDEAIHFANGTDYGLAASIWTSNNARAKRVAAKIESGIVWVNCWNLRDLQTPFGGFKKSGVGREGGKRALEFFTEEKTVTAPL